MMQSYASRVWLQSGGPILLTGIYAMLCYRVATTPYLHGRIRGHPDPTDEFRSSVVQNHVAGFRMAPSGGVIPIWTPFFSLAHSVPYRNFCHG